MPFLTVLMIFSVLFYLPLADSTTNDQDSSLALPECPKSFSGKKDSRKKEDFHQRANHLLSQISRSSSSETAKILKPEHPETLRILSKGVFYAQGMYAAKYKLAYALGANQTDDPEIHRLLSDALLYEVNKGVQRKIAEALGQINGKIDPEDSHIQSNLVEVIRSQAEVGIKVEAIYALGETRSKDIEVHWFLMRRLLSPDEPPVIKQAIVKAFRKMKSSSPGISDALLTALLSEETAPETKQFVAAALGEMSSLGTDTLQEMARMLSMHRELDAEEMVKVKQKVAEAIKKKQTTDPKTHELLAEALAVLTGEKYALVREEIYSLFESVSQHIRSRIRQRLTNLIGSPEYSYEEKQRIIEILNQSHSRYKAIVQSWGIGWLASLF